MNASTQNTTTPTRPSAVRRSLVALNAVLLGVLVLVVFSPAAVGQRGNAPGARQPGRYTIVSGEVQGAPSAGMFVLDTANRELVALLWDDNDKRFRGIGYRSLDSDAAGGAQPR